MSAPHSDDVPRNRLAASLADLDGLDLDAPTWAEVTGKPSTFPPSAHKHPWADITDPPATYPPNTHTHTWSEVQSKPTTFPPDTHTHTTAQVTGLQAALDDKEKVPWQGTQAQYDALGSYESDRTYYITD